MVDYKSDVAKKAEELKMDLKIPECKSDMENNAKMDLQMKPVYIL